MKLFFQIQLFVLLISYSPLSAQSMSLSKVDLNKIQTYEDSLATLAHGVMNAEITDTRILACHEMIPMLVKALKISNSFQYPFPRLENVSIQYPQDSSFRIFTWQLKISDAQYKYFGALQFNQVQLKLIPLSDRSYENNNVQYSTVTTDKWYGNVLYNIKDFTSSDGSTEYILFGYNAFNINDRRKIIDVLWFKDGKAHFGKPIFRYDKGNTKSRVIYQFSADAGIKVNYDETEKMIVCDHLQEIQGNLPGQGRTNVPDGSYEGFKLEKGIWKYISDVFDSGNGKNQRAFVNKAKIPAPVPENNQSKPSKSKN